MINTAPFPCYGHIFASERECLTLTLSLEAIPCNIVHLTQPIEIFGNLSIRHLVLWPHFVIQVKFYDDRPRGTPPLGELNTRGVAEYSDFGPIERYISETV